MSHRPEDAGIERCEGCGLEIAGGTSGCQFLFDELLARGFSDPLSFSVHRMVVDVYSLQHPDRYCRSPKSLAAHLCGLCQILEGGVSKAVGDESLRRWLNGKALLTKPDLPEFRGNLTIEDVRRASTASYAETVERWAASTWAAYAPIHHVAREWLARARLGQ